MTSTDPCWDAVKSYFANGVRRLVDHQVDSYEDFIRNKLPLIVQSTPPIKVWHEQHPVHKKYKYEFTLTFENISYMKPRITEATGRIKPMLPMEARVRNFTYAAQMHADIRFTAKTYSGDTYATCTEESRVFEGISLGKLPVLLGSSLCLLKDYPLSLEQVGECGHDPLGYFLIHGSERTILCQEKVADNRIMVFQSKKASSKHSYSVELKSLSETFTMPPKKLEPMLAIQMASRLLFVFAGRPSGSSFSMAELLVTCSITSNPSTSSSCRSVMIRCGGSLRTIRSASSGLLAPETR